MTSEWGGFFKGMPAIGPVLLGYPSIDGSNWASKVAVPATTKANMKASVNMVGTSEVMECGVV